MMQRDSYAHYVRNPRFRLKENAPLTQKRERKHFAYTKSGVAKARAYAKMNNGRMVSSHKKDANTKYRRK